MREREDFADFSNSPHPFLERLFSRGRLREKYALFAQRYLGPQTLDAAGSSLNEDLFVSAVEVLEGDIDPDIVEVVGQFFDPYVSMLVHQARHERPDILHMIGPDATEEEIGAAKAAFEKGVATIKRLFGGRSKDELKEELPKFLIRMADAARKT